MYSYCGNNPISRIDPNGNSFWEIMEWIGIGLTFIGSVIAIAFPGVGTVIGGITALIGIGIRDISLLAGGKVYYKNGTIVNSSQVVLPTSLLVYSIYLKYYSPYKDDFKGSAMGIYWEWQLHNITSML